MNQAIVQMDQVTQQNAALVEESAAAAASMANQARELAGVVAAFRTVAASQGINAAHTPAAQAAPAPKVAAPAATWNGIERRGPHRATNVARPKFGSKPRLQKSSEPLLADARRTGTDDSWAEF